MTPFANFVLEKRQALGLAQNQLAQKLNVTSSYMRLIEKGAKVPGNLVFLDSLAECFGLSADETKKLRALAKLSQRTIRLPADTPVKGYLIISNLVSSIADFDDAQLDLLEKTINKLLFGAVKPDQTSPNEQDKSKRIAMDTG